MPAYCCVPYCRSTKKEETNSFHEIPADTNRRILWLEAIAKQGLFQDSPWIPNQYARVCRKHFRKDDFRRMPEDYRQIHKRTLLKYNAVPSIFPDTPSHLKSPLKRARLPVLRTESENTSAGPEVPHILESINEYIQSKNRSSQPLEIDKDLQLENTSVEPSDGSEFLENDKDLQLENTSVEPSDGSEFLENDKDLQSENTSLELSDGSEAFGNDEDLQSQNMSAKQPDGSESSENDEDSPPRYIFVKGSDRSESSESDEDLQSKSMSARQIGRSEPSGNDNHSFDSSSSTILGLQIQNAHLKQKFRKARREVKHLDRQNKSLSAKIIELSEKLTEYSDIEKEAAAGSEHARFIMDQIRSHNKKYFRWSPEVVKMCIPWQKCYPRGYEYVRNSKMLNLPCKTTISNHLRTAPTL